MCGKNTACLISPWTILGSPPRVREKPNIKLIAEYSGGITPACAGKTYSMRTCKRLSRDHPRVCGKNDNKVIDTEKVLGSPPRVREKRLVAVIDRLKTRITPACAGKTLPFFGECTTSQDHPRVCGKNLSSKAASQRMVGSPPRVREKQQYP